MSMKLLRLIQWYARPNNLMRARISIRWTSTLAHTRDVNDQIKITTKERKKPFVKNMFLGKFDTDILSFPEVLPVDRLKELELKVSPIYDIFQRDALQCDSKQKLEESKAFKLFGLQVPLEYGGLNLNSTEYARFSEVVSKDGPAAIALTAHQTYGLSGLLTLGNQKQKEQYLPRLASGEWVAAFCFAEPRSAKDVLGVDAEATLVVDKWYINGSKVIINGDGNADLFTVIARTQKEEYGGRKSHTLTAFLVERTFEGISFDKTIDIVGNRGANMCEVSFNNTPVPVENILGEEGDGFKLCSDTLGSNRFSAGSFAAGILKTILGRVAEHCVNQKQLGKSLMDFELIKAKIAKIVFSIYILESLTYVTAGISDTYENPDISVESAIVKVLSSDILSKCILESQNILGAIEFFKTQAYDTILRDSKVYMLLEGTNEMLRMFIALSGLQHAGKELKDVVEKTRNPAMHPSFVFKKIFERRNHIKDNPKLTLGLHNYVHPSLDTAAKNLEYCVLRLQYVVEILLTRHGRGIIEKEIELDRLTDIVISLYVMTAVLARASRSYCTGIQNAEDEMFIATTICHNNWEMVKEKVRHIQDGPFICLDKNYTKVAEKVYDYKGYFIEHPLTRNIF